MTHAGTATVEIKADTSKFLESVGELQTELDSLSFWQRPSITQVVQTLTLLAILWRVW